MNGDDLFITSNYNLLYFRYPSKQYVICLLCLIQHLWEQVSNTKNFRHLANSKKYQQDLNKRPWPTENLAKSEIHELEQIR